MNTCLEKRFFAKVEQKQKLPASGCWYYSASIRKINGPNPVKVARRCRSVRVGVERKRLCTQRPLGFGLLSPPHLRGSVSLSPRPPRPRFHLRASNRPRPLPPRWYARLLSDPPPPIPFLPFSSLINCEIGWGSPPLVVGVRGLP